MFKQLIKLREYINQQLKAKITLRLKSTSYLNTPTTVANYKDLKKLQLSRTKQQYISAIVTMLKKFKLATTQLSINLKLIVCYAQLKYQLLFNFLNKITQEVGKDLNYMKNTKQLEIVKAAVNKGKVKLLKYYIKTRDKQDFIFNYIIVLELIQKLTIYKVS